MNQETFDYEINKIVLNKGDILAITIKSDDIDSATLRKFEESIKPKFPENDVLMIAVSTQEGIEYARIVKE
jgi:hypothetical protein